MSGGLEPERFLKLDEVKRRAGLGKSMTCRLISEGKFPAVAGCFALERARIHRLDRGGQGWLRGQEAPRLKPLSGRLATAA